MNFYFISINPGHNLKSYSLIKSLIVTLSFFSFLEEPHPLTQKNVQLTEDSGFLGAKGIMPGVWIWSGQAAQRRSPGRW